MVVTGILLTGRMALPFVVQRLMNDRLERIPGYTGHVDKVGLHLWRGAYSLHGFQSLRAYTNVDVGRGTFRLVAAFTWVVKDKFRDQLATRIPSDGKFGDAKVGLLASIANLFRRGFIRAFNPTVEDSVRAGNILPSGKSAGGNAVAKNQPYDQPAEAEKPAKP